MTITVFGATGQVGKRVVRYALDKGHTVRAFGRNITKLIDEDLANDKLEAIRGHLFDKDEVFDAVEGVDAVISVIGGSFDGSDKARSLGMKNIAEQMQKAGVERIIALGGMGVLSDAAGNYLLDAPDYPQQYLPVGREHLQAYLHLKESNLQWTFVCSPDIKDEPATGKFMVSDTHPPQPNKYQITAGDLALFMINEAQECKHVKQRVGISAE